MKKQIKRTTGLVLIVLMGLNLASGAFAMQADDIQSGEVITSQLVDSLDDAKNTTDIPASSFATTLKTFCSKAVGILPILYDSFNVIDSSHQLYCLFVTKSMPKSWQPEYFSSTELEPSISINELENAFQDVLCKMGLSSQNISLNYNYVGNHSYGTNQTQGYVSIDQWDPAFRAGFYKKGGSLLEVLFSVFGKKNLDETIKRNEAQNQMKFILGHEVSHIMHNDLVMRPIFNFTVPFILRYSLSILNKKIQKYLSQVETKYEEKSFQAQSVRISKKFFDILCCPISSLILSNILFCKLLNYQEFQADKNAALLLGKETTESVINYFSEVMSIEEHRPLWEKVMFLLLGFDSHPSCQSRINALKQLIESQKI